MCDCTLRIEYPGIDTITCKIQTKALNIFITTRMTSNMTSSVALNQGSHPASKDYEDSREKDRINRRHEKEQDTNASLSNAQHLDFFSAHLEVLLLFHVKLIHVLWRF